MSIRKITRIVFVLIIFISSVAFYDFFSLSKEIRRNNESGKIIDALNTNIFKLMLLSGEQATFNDSTNGDVWYKQQDMVNREIVRLGQHIDEGHKNELDSITASNNEIKRIISEIFSGTSGKKGAQTDSYRQLLIANLYSISGEMYYNTLMLHREINDIHRQRLEWHLRHLKIILSVSFIIVISVAGIYWVRFLNPLFKLAAILPTSVSGGSFHNIRFKSNDELGVLINSVNRTFSLLEEANKANKEFVANMNHELKTPLNGIIGLSSSLIESDINPRQKQDAVRIHESATALLNIMNDIISISKLEKSTVTLIENTFNINETISNVINLFRAEADDRGLKLNADIGADVPRGLFGDSTKLKQILMVLLSNAVKFTRDGGITISLKTVKTEEDRVYIDFSVADTGIGISAEHLADIFSGFRQIDSGTGRRYEGVGFSLPIADRLVNLLGGQMKAESIPEVGSVFSFVLPFTAQEDAETLIECAVPECIDISYGMDKVSNNRALYIKLIRMFYQSESDCMPRLEDAVRNDMPSAVRTAHSIKGASANIGAVYLSRAAGDLESAFRDGGKHEKLMVNFGHELGKVLLSIVHILDSESAAEKTCDGAGDIRPEGYDELILMVEQSDADALDVAERMLAEAAGAYEDRLTRALDRLNQFDFRQALEILRS